MLSTFASCTTYHIMSGQIVASLLSLCMMTAQMVTRLTFCSYKCENRKISMLSIGVYLSSITIWSMPFVVTFTLLMPGALLFFLRKKSRRSIESNQLHSLNTLPVLKARLAANVAIPEFRICIG